MLEAQMLFALPIYLSPDSAHFHTDSINIFFAFGMYEFFNLLSLSPISQKNRQVIDYLRSGERESGRYRRIHEMLPSEGMNTKRYW